MVHMYLLVWLLLSIQHMYIYVKVNGDSSPKLRVFKITYTYFPTMISLRG